MAASPIVADASTAPVRLTFVRRSQKVTKARRQALDRVVRAVERVNQTRERMCDAAIFGTPAEYKKAAAAHERALQARCKALSAA